MYARRRGRAAAALLSAAAQPGGEERKRTPPPRPPSHPPPHPPSWSPRAQHGLVTTLFDQHGFPTPKEDEAAYQVTDDKGKEVAVPAARLAFVELGPAGSNPIGFG